MALEMSNQNSVPIVSTKSDSASINLSSEAMQNIWDKIATPQIKGYFVYGGLDTVQDNTTIASYCKLSELSNNNDISFYSSPDRTPNRSVPELLPYTFSLLFAFPICKAAQKIRNRTFFNRFSPISDYDQDIETNCLHAFSLDLANQILYM